MTAVPGKLDWNNAMQPFDAFMHLHSIQKVSHLNNGRLELFLSGVMLAVNEVI